MGIPVMSAALSPVQQCALRRVAGEAAVALIRREANPAVAQIIAGWPRSFDAAPAQPEGPAP